MRTTSYLALLGAAVISVLPGCTVKDVDQPALVGPSTFAHSLVMVADRDTLTQNGVDFTDIRIQSISPTGQSESLSLRAQIFVDGIAQDFGTLSTKTPVAPTTIRYTAPQGSTIAASQLPTTVTIVVTPSSSGDFRGEVARQLDLRLVPQGVILPTNPNLVADFTSPTAPEAFQSVTFDASTTQNNSAPCGVACTYSWNFGDGTTGFGMVITHVFRAAGSFQVTLTVADARGAQSTKTKSITVAPPKAPEGQKFTTSPSPAAVDVDVFFNASSVTWGNRTIVSYNWNFGDGSSGTGVTTTHKYTRSGAFTVTLTLTDDAGATGTVSQELAVVASVAEASFEVIPAAPKPGQRTVLDASKSKASPGGTVVEYKFDFGDGTVETSNNPVQSHIYAAGTYVAAVTITDSNGKTATKAIPIEVKP